MTPIGELPLERVTKSEADAYGRWRDGYQNNFSWAFDPIALKFTVNSAPLAGDLTVMPLIDNTDYREFVALSRGAKLKPTSGDPHSTRFMRHWRSTKTPSESSSLQASRSRSFRN